MKSILPLYCDGKVALKPSDVSFSLLTLFNCLVNAHKNLKSPFNTGMNIDRLIGCTQLG